MSLSPLVMKPYGVGEEVEQNCFTRRPSARKAPTSSVAMIFKSIPCSSKRSYT